MKRSLSVSVLIIFSLVFPAIPLSAANTNPQVVTEPPMIEPGSAPRPFLFGPQVEVTAENIQIGITGVGWTAEKKKSVRLIDPLEQHSRPPFFDLCKGAPCSEREDGLRLIAVVPRSTPAGSHTLIVTEEGGHDVRISFITPELPENKKVEEQKATIFLVDPPAATVDVIAISVRGAGWGPYDDRRSVKAWLVDPDTEQFHELRVDRNYRDCLFVPGGNNMGECILESDEIFLRLEIPDGIKPQLEPKKYFLMIEAEKSVRSAAVFTVLAKPKLDSKKGAAVALIPDHGPTDTSTLLFGAGFPKKQIIDVRMDGIYIRLGGALWPNDDGTFDNIPLTIPRTLKRNGKETTVAPGPHTITVSAGKVSATTTFVVEGSVQDKKEEKEQKKKEEERLKKERDEKEKLLKEEERLKKEQEQVKKEEERLEKERKKLEEELKKKKEQEKREKDEEDKARLEKERKKLEEELKKKKEQEKKKEEQIEDIKDKREAVNDQFCDPNLPITFQPGCIQKTATPKKSKYEGKPCSADRAITLQPGCIGQNVEEQKQFFAGKTCVSNLPITFQPGCIPSKPVGEPSIQYYTPDSSGKICRKDVAITFQPGCIAQQTETEQSAKPFAGKACDLNLPRVWQEGCIDQKQTTVSAKEAPLCNPLIPTYAQPRCKQQ